MEQVPRKRGKLIRHMGQDHSNGHTLGNQRTRNLHFSSDCGPVEMDIRMQETRILLREGRALLVVSTPSLHAPVACNEIPLRSRQIPSLLFSLDYDQVAT